MTGRTAAAPRTAAKTTPPAVRTGPSRQRWRGTLLTCSGLVGLAVLLEVLPRTGLVDRGQLPPTSTMVTTLAEALGTAEFWQALGDTMLGWAIGLAVAVAAGTAAGLLIGGVPLLHRLTQSTIEFLRPIPAVALVPLTVLVFGTDMRATLVLVIYGSFWQMLLQVIYGVHDVDPMMRDTARSLRFSARSTLRFVLWPTALPYVITGFRLAATVALVLEVTGELVIGSPGLGGSIAQARTFGNVPTVYALVIVTGCLGVAVNLLTRQLERRLLRWHPSVRAEAS